MKLLKRAVPAAAAAVLALAALAACSSSAPASGPVGSGGSNGSGGSSAAIPLLRVGTTGGTSTLDPLTTQGCATDFCGLFMERLMKFSADGKLEPQLATSITQPNADTYVFNLRHGVKFWDGNEMTSADVVASLEYQAAPGTETTTYYTDVKSIAADGKYAVTVTLKQPNSSWPQNMAYEGVIFEKSFQQAHKATFGKPGTLVMATGPWEVTSFDPTTGIDLTANPHWWGGKVPIQQISFKFFSTETSEALAMRASEIDVAFPSDGRSFAASSGAKVTSWLNNEIGFFSMNVNQAPWNDIHVRRAVAYALNRTDIIAADGGASSAQPLYDFYPAIDLNLLGTPAQVSAITAALPKYTFNLAAAKAQLAASAYPKGFTASMEVCDTGNLVDTDQVVVAELQRIGIDIKLKSVTCDAWVNELYGTKNFGPMFTTSHSSIVDPAGLSAYMLGSQAIPVGGLNEADYSPASVDSLLNASVATSDPATRLAIYQKVLTHLATDLPYVPLFQDNAFLATSSKFTLPALGMDSFELAWALNVKAAS
jgi:peptide/nickel transport system substrate-binding protein